MGLRGPRRCYSQEIYDTLFLPRIERLKLIGFEVTGFEPGVDFYKISECRNGPNGITYGHWNSFTLNAKEWDILDCFLVLLLKTMSPEQVQQELERSNSEIASFMDKAKQSIPPDSTNPWR